MNRNLTTGGNSPIDTEEIFASNLDERSLRALIHKIIEKPKESQSIPTRNKYEALATDDSDVEDMQEGTNDEIPENTKEEQSKKDKGRNKTAKPQKQEEFKHKVAPIIIKETAKWTKTSNMMKRKNITATKCKVIQTGIEVEPATEDDYRKLSKMLKEEGIQFYTFQLKSEKKLKVVLRGITQDITDDEIKDDLQQQDYSVEKISRMKAPLVLIEVSREYKSIYNIANCCGLAIEVEPERSEIVQYHKSQMFGHPQSNCNINYKCMKCYEGDSFMHQIEDYSTKLCQLPGQTSVHLHKVPRET
ncbi:hypothetical protein Trydic_g4251 [Trypoxylus dichotomus]